jgi:hypothetical protein
MATQNDNAIDQLARTICRCVQGQVSDDAIHDHVEEIVKSAESRAANFLRENTGGTGPAKSRHDRLRSGEWALRRQLDEFPSRALHDPAFAVDPETLVDLARAYSALAAANSMIARASVREGHRGGDAQ